MKSAFIVSILLLAVPAFSEIPAGPFPNSFVLSKDQDVVEALEKINLSLGEKKATQVVIADGEHHNPVLKKFFSLIMQSVQSQNSNFDCVSNEIYPEPNLYQALNYNKNLTQEAWGELYQNFSKYNAHLYFGMGVGSSPNYSEKFAKEYADELWALHLMGLKVFGHELDTADHVKFYLDLDKVPNPGSMTSPLEYDAFVFRRNKVHIEKIAQNYAAHSCHGMFVFGGAFHMLSDTEVRKYAENRKVDISKFPKLESIPEGLQNRGHKTLTIAVLPLEYAKDPEIYSKNYDLTFYVKVRK